MTTQHAHPRRIVLVDDEEALAWSLASRLSKARDVEVETANDGEPALAMLQARPADLLIADVRMPKMSGIDLVLAARKIHRELPVIAMTAFKTADVQRVAGASYTSFLEKPFEFDRLLELVDRAFAKPKVGFSGAISVQTLPDDGPPSGEGTPPRGPWPKFTKTSRVPGTS